MAGLHVGRKILLGILTSICWIHGLRASCSPGWFGDSCGYSCNCGSCDETTGICDGDCTAGWMKGGGHCQKVNIALEKPASTTSGVYQGWTANKAVDGDNDVYGLERTCFHAGSVPSDWTVDLEQEYQLYDIRVYLRNGFEYRTAESIIYLDNNSSRLCYTFPSTTPSNPTDVTCNGTARYVTVRNQRAGDKGYLNICEVEIYGCSNGTYGSNCDVFCHCSHCDRWTGVCSGDCSPGWEGERCDTAICPPGRFGDSCSYSCNCGLCTATGVCGGDCAAGYIKGAGLCQTVNIALRKPASTTSEVWKGWTTEKAVDGDNNINGERRTCFHADYSPSDLTVDLEQDYQLYDIRVYLRNGYEKRTDGSSIYLDNNPSQVCFTFPSSISDNPTYVTCNGTARNVTIRTPGNGRQHVHDNALNICEVEIYVCSDGTYGSNCDVFCHCPYCDRWTGVCSGDCSPGWEGERCDTECRPSTYGINCSKTCSDRKCIENTTSCDRYTGSCGTGCVPGYKSDDCTTECDGRQYGVNCSIDCTERHCYGNSSCDHVTGSCDQGCAAGWKGLDCLQGCIVNTTYGMNCKNRCSDRKCTHNNASCDRFTGTCDAICRPGWRGLDCSTECDKTTYGANCSSVCAERHCSGNASCDHVTGSCDQGCQAGWKGSDCTQVCDSDHYGPNCTGVCVKRHCEGNSTCSPTRGQCDGRCQTGWVGEDCNTKSIVSDPDDKTGTDQIPKIAGAAVGGVAILVLVLVLVFIIARNRRVKSSKESSRPPVEMDEKKHNEPGHVYANIGFDEGKKNTSEASPVTPAIGQQNEQSGGADRFPGTLEEEEAEEELEERNNTQQDVPERNYYNLDDMHRGNMIPLSQLAARVREMEKRPDISEEEFKNLPNGFFHPYDESQKPGNKAKNRFRGYYPYNYNRVILHDSSDDSRGNYINASYLDGYNHEKQYIAAQGPYKDDIIDDFVRMIWQEECKVVVMVTGLVEGGKMKCLRYWPEEGTSTHGSVTVTMETQTRLADFTITKLAVQEGQESMKRHVTHFNFTSWPDHGVPNTFGLLTFMRRVQKTCGQQKHPVVVHCSAGIGRTGTYIAVESLMNQATTEGTVDVVSFVSNMRSQRKNMIQTAEQYLFIYQAVMTAMVEGDTSLDADIIRNEIDLDDLNSITMGNKAVRQHLESLETRTERRAPPDSITMVPSYQTKSGFFVMTSHPDKERVWSQIYNSNSRTLITWSDDEEVESYLPSVDRSVTTSRLTVTLTSSSILSECVTHNKIGIREKNDKEAIIIHHYHVTGSVRDPSVSVLIDSLLQWTGQPKCESTTIVSHSVSKSRLLILLVNIASRLQDDGKIDVISNMRRLQSLLGGPRFNVDDVRMCLEFAQRQFESRGVYANV